MRKAFRDGGSNRFEMAEESSGCRSVLYYKKLLFLDCIKMIGHPEKKTVQK